MTYAQPSPVPLVSTPAHPLADIVLPDADGRDVQLGELWRDQTVVFVFVRHFGCLFCKQQVAEVTARLDELEGKGARVVVVGNGSIEEARAFAETDARRMLVVTDPAKVAYCAVGMTRSVRSSASLSTAKAAARALRQGFRQTHTQGDPFQQGGVVVVAPGGHERYRFTSASAGDHPSLDDVIASL